MISSRPVISACFVVCSLLLGACSSHPGMPSGDDPAFTGYTYGWENDREDPTAAATSSVAGDPTARGGYTYGSGN